MCRNINMCLIKITWNVKQISYNQKPKGKTDSELY